MATYKHRRSEKLLIIKLIRQIVIHFVCFQVQFSFLLFLYTEYNRYIIANLYVLWFSKSVLWFMSVLWKVLSFFLK
jgi:hypothetical protein